MRLAPQYGHRLRTPEYFLSHLAHLISETMLTKIPSFISGAGDQHPDHYAERYRPRILLAIEFYIIFQEMSIAFFE